MTEAPRKSAAALAARRQALIAECGLQRVNAGRELIALTAPLHPEGGWRQYLAGNLKAPLIVAVVVAGIVATRSGRILPVITAGLSTLKLARSALALLRGQPARTP